MVTNDASTKNPLLDKYDIAEPIAYPAYKPPSEKHSTHSPEPKKALLGAEHAEFVSDEKKTEGDRGPYKESWDDSNKGGAETMAKFALFAPLSKQADTAGHAKGSHHAGREMRAIWIVHGMGQQVPFETVDSLAQGVLRAAYPAGANAKERPPLRLRTVKLGDQTLQRVELDVDGKEEDSHGKPLRQYELHLYEAYWAPKTEGVAKLADVVSFLLDGATRGLLNSVQKFKRAMFGDMEGFKIPIRSPIWILLTLLVLASLTVINGVIVAAAAAVAKLPILSTTPLGTNWGQLTALASWMTAVAFTFGTVLYLAEMSRPDDLPRWMRLSLSVVGWVATGTTSLAIVATACVMGLATYTNDVSKWLQQIRPAQIEHVQSFATALILLCAFLVGASTFWRGHLRSTERELRANPVLLLLFWCAFAIHIFAVALPVMRLAGHHFGVSLPAYLRWLSSTIWVWPFLIALAAQVRTILVEYVGDVAIYVTPNKLDRFDDVRNKIKDIARGVASSIYLACEPGTNGFLYTEIAAVGHSLGSVIAYDTLNRLMLDDWLGKNYLGIANRTNSLVTFGSPLDKTAFLFTIQGTENLHIRERLAATVQPIIQSYPKFRKFPWVNVHSYNDIISGRLVFYDVPEVQADLKEKDVQPPAVQNMVDEEASVPLVAHVDYWKNELVWKQLFERIAP